MNTGLLLRAGTLTAVFYSAGAFADTSLYFGAGIGAATLDDDGRFIGVDDETDTWRLVTGLQLGDSLSLDAGYHDLGRLAATDFIGFPGGRSNLTVDGWTFGGTLSLPVSDSLTLFGRGGVFVWDAAIDANGLRNSLADDSDPYYGAGARVALNRSFSLVGDWSRFEFDEVDADVFSIGFEYRFGF